VAIRSRFLSDLLQTNVEKVANGKARYSYEATLKAAQQVNWRIEDIIGGKKRLDFAKRFMPESLARVDTLNFLTQDEKRILNQIRGNAYLRIFWSGGGIHRTFCVGSGPPTTSRR
jgi:hypothetical protein